MSHDWERAVPILKEAAKAEATFAASSPLFLSQVDQMRAAMRDDLDRLGLMVASEGVVFAGLVFTTVVYQVAEWVESIGLLKGEPPLEVVRIVTGMMGLLLAPYAPDEARR